MKCDIHDNWEQILHQFSKKLRFILSPCVFNFSLNMWHVWRDGWTNRQMNRRSSKRGSQNWKTFEKMNWKTSLLSKLLPLLISKIFKIWSEEKQIWLYSLDFIQRKRQNTKNFLGKTPFLLNCFQGKKFP